MTYIISLLCDQHNKIVNPSLFLSLTMHIAFIFLPAVNVHSTIVIDNCPIVLCSFSGVHANFALFFRFKFKDAAIYKKCIENNRKVSKLIYKK